jgi:hypothetical protein
VGKSERFFMDNFINMEKEEINLERNGELDRKADMGGGVEAQGQSRRGRKSNVKAISAKGLKGGRMNDRSSGEVHRVVISKESNEALESVLKRCQEGFDAGTITKSDVANYYFKSLNKSISEADIKNLKATHFDEKKVLSSILRDENDLPEELRKAIRSHYGVSPRGR